MSHKLELYMNSLDELLAAEVQIFVQFSSDKVLPSSASQHTM